MSKSKKEIIEKLKKAGMSLRKSPWLERAKERQRKRSAPDYKGFCEHYQEYVEFGVPIGIRDLVDLAERYNCPIPKFKDGNPVFEEASDDSK